MFHFTGLRRHTRLSYRRNKFRRRGRECLHLCERRLHRHKCPKHLLRPKRLELKRSSQLWGLCRCRKRSSRHRQLCRGGDIARQSKFPRCWNWTSSFCARDPHPVNHPRGSTRRQLRECGGHVPYRERPVQHCARHVRVLWRRLQPDDQPCRASSDGNTGPRYQPRARLPLGEQHLQVYPFLLLMVIGGKPIVEVPMMISADPSITLRSIRR